MIYHFNLNIDMKKYIKKLLREYNGIVRKVKIK